MPALFYLLPSFCALIGILSVLMTYFFIWRKLEKSKLEILKRFGQKFDKAEMQGEFNEILEDKLKEFIDDLRNQIPMGAMLLTDALSKKIRDIAREGFLKILPDMKEHLINKMSHEMQIEAIILSILRNELYVIVILGGVLGFILGLFLVLLV